MSYQPDIAVLIPCYNEGAAIAPVVAAFRRSLPAARIYVYDNNSSDDTQAQARAVGAIVRSESRQGKGNVVCRMFADIDADVYVLVDGDGTYDAAQAPQLVAKLLSGPFDMVNGRRVETAQKNYRPGHRLGNALLTGLVAAVFSRQFTDMLSGFKLFSRRYVKSFPAQSQGFEIETQLTVHALQMGMAVAEVDTLYIDRMEGSTSKLSTWKDGFRILKTIVRLVKNERPFEFFGGIAALLALAAAVLFSPILVGYLQTGLVPRFPTLIVATGLGISALLSLLTGLLLEAVTLAKRETRRLSYLAIPAFYGEQALKQERSQ
jgi:glycosyltransferase involved in cell wall biosynthesis